MISEKISNNRRYDIAATLILLATFFLCIYKCRFGFDWSDETLYSALSHRFLTGDRFFVEAGGALQIAGMLMVPFTWMFEKITGGTEGIMLYFRILYTAFSFIAALYAYRVSARQRSCLGGILFGILLMIYSPHSISSMGYNNILYLFGIFSALLVIEKYDGSIVQKVKYFFGGLFCGIAVAAYPPFIIIIPVMFLFICFHHYEKKSKDLRKVLTPLVIFMAGGLCIALLISLVILVTSSFANVVESFQMKTEVIAERKQDIPESSDFTVVNFFRELFLPVEMKSNLILISYLASVAYCCIKRWDKCGFLRMVIAAWILLSILLCVLEVSNMDRYNFFTIPVAIHFPAIYILFFRKPDWTIFLYIVGVLMSLSVFYGSNTGMFGASYALMLCNMSTILFCLKVCQDNNSSESKRLTRRSCWNSPYTHHSTARTLSGVLIAALLIVFVMSTKFTYVYRDAPWNQLNSEIEQGPAAGLYTTTESSEKYSVVYNTVVEYVKDDDRVLYSKLMPFAYTSTMAKATPRNLYRVEINSPSNNEILKRYPERMPTIVIVFDEDYGITNEDNPMEGYLAEELLSGKYEIIEAECGTIYRLR